MITRSLLLHWSRGAFVEELPGANTQGDTLEEARSNLVDTKPALRSAWKSRSNVLRSAEVAEH